ncbi:multidrug and toxin extrusion protein 1-like isoform X2 [Apostichopus japonicus]|uniref:multidrug and toxin extrusion protein 1-like isoform X2 n=1 Tax=Stichopus japonicus TaxID=307972 RepID=UPI003AB6AC37
MNEKGEAAPIGEGRLCCKHCTLKFTKQEVFQEVKKIISLAWPTSAYLLLNYGVNFAPIIFNGRLGTTQLAAASLSVAVLGATVRAIGIGFTSACETFFAQADILGMVLVKYLQCQSILLPIVAILIIVNIINVGMHYLFMIVLEMGLRGSPLALVTTMYSLVFLLIAYIYFKGIYKTTWSGWSRKCLEGWGKFYKLGVAGSLMVSFEWWSFEIGLFLAGLIGETAIGVQSVLLHLISAAYMIPLGVSISASIRVGNSLGANQPNKAILVSFSALLVCWIFAVVEAIVFSTLKNKLGYIFTDDQDIIDQASSAIQVFALLVFFDNTASCFSGIVRGTGHQVLGAVINLVGFYIIGVPLSVSLLFFTKFQITGYWLGQTFALFTQSLMFALFVCNLNWPVEARRALRNAGVLGTLILPAATEQETGLDSTAGDLAQQELLEGNNPPNISKDTTISEANNETQVDTPLAEGLEIQNIQPPICEHSIEEEVVTSKDSFRFILLKRFLYFVFLLCLLLIGIFCRCFFLHDGSFVFQGNDTYIYENYDTGTARYGIDN